ncbi:hypothetical protein BC937DRAFT_92806 [Endogone sp. FLAS-F59071]|nr:hypothetical protein BC937DRAFT_92806 [Endogone sp. FLAS-F59071]|eukprot:RUS15167.1 hypothetical protein BC937DRAFT_92806 [Endogone sp. FLAS-F59071]
MPPILPAELVDYIFFLTSDLLTCLNGFNIHSARRLYQPHLHTYHWAATHLHGAAAIPFLHRYETLCGTPVAGNPAFATSIAAGLGHLDTVKALLRVRKDLKNLGPLDYACGRGHLEVARYLHAEGMWCTSDAFIRACEAGHVEVLRFLLEIGAPVRAAPSVHAAVRNGHVQVLRFIQSMGQWPLSEGYKQQKAWGRRLESSTWHTPSPYHGEWDHPVIAMLSDEAMMLEETAIAGHVEMVRYLMGDLRDVWDSRMVTIDTAALAGREDVVRVMIEECGARKVFGSTLNVLAQEGIEIKQASTRDYLERKRADLIILSKWELK